MRGHEAPTSTRHCFSLPPGGHLLAVCNSALPKTPVSGRSAPSTHITHKRNKRSHLIAGELSLLCSPAARTSSAKYTPLAGLYAHPIALGLPVRAQIVPINPQLGTGSNRLQTLPDLYVRPRQHSRTTAPATATSGIHLSTPLPTSTNVPFAFFICNPCAGNIRFAAT